MALIMGRLCPAMDGSSKLDDDNDDDERVLSDIYLLLLLLVSTRANAKINKK